MSDTEILVRSVLSGYGVQDPTATEDIMDIFRSMNRKKLTDSEVRTLRMKHRAGATQLELAKEFGINPATVSRIVRGLFH